MLDRPRGVIRGPRHGRHGRDPLRRRAGAAPRRHRVLQAELLAGSEPAQPRRRRARHRSASTSSCGAATIPTRKAPALHPGAPAPALGDAPGAELRQILADNAAKLYGFDLDELPGPPAAIGPTVAEVATPIEAVPDKELQRISGDMDYKAIK